MKKAMKTKDRMKVVRYFSGKSPESFLNDLRKKALEVEKQINRNETNLLIGKDHMFINESGIVCRSDPEQSTYEKKYLDLRSNAESLIYDIERLAEISRSLAANEFTISDNPGGIFQMQEMILSKIKVFQSGSIDLK